MDSIKKEVMEIEQNTAEFKDDQLQENISSTPSSTAQNKLDAAAALVSLVQIIDRIKPNAADEKQIESLIENTTFFQDFFNGGVSREEDGLGNRVANAAYAATDIIQAQLVDHQILFESISCFELFRDLCTKCTTFRDKINIQGLQKVIEDMDLIKKEITEMKEKTALHINVSMVGFDDVLLEIIYNLTGGGQLNLQIVPIVGMGGIGKTTLARNIYTHPLIKEHFDVCAWVTISQEYNTQEILRDILSQVKGESNETSKFGLRESLSKFLAARRYLIVMDDMWSVDAWDKMKFSFPDYKNGSRIVVTTRLSNLASQLTYSYVLNMKLLDEINSWNLFSKTVFGEESCPDELEQIGERIVRNCGGLPLSIVVVGGLVLSKSKHTTTYWEYIEENLSSVVNSDNDEHCLKILHMSYNELPVYLKPCFLYVGVFKEDYEIRVSKLIKLWVAEGFLNPFSGKSLEETAQEFLKELIKRNLLSIHEFGSTGNIKYCKIHDLLRDLCLIEARKEKFYNVMIMGHASTKIPQRRVVIPSEYEDAIPLHSRSVRSLICGFGGEMPLLNLLPLLRVLEDSDEELGYGETHLQENMSRLVNLRYVAVKGYRDFKFLPSMSLLWNLHTLIFVDNYFSTITAPDEFWSMSQLRHVEFITLYLPYPTSTSSVDDIVLNKLHTLRNIYDFTCGEEMVKRIPNIKKLKVCYKKLVEGSSPYHLNNLDRLHKLQSFHCSCWLDTRPSGDLDFLQGVAFPNSLKKLSIGGDHIHWEDLLEKIGSLPLLQKLKLFCGSFRRSEWETVEGQFCSLKFLHVDSCYNLECWTTESSHFPRLERLVLEELRELKEIPSDIGNVPTLKLLKVKKCHDSAIDSARRICEEQEELGNEGLQVQLVPIFNR